MTDLEFLAAQKAYLYAPKGLKQQRLKALQAVTKRLLKAGKRKGRKAA